MDIGQLITDSLCLGVLLFMLPTWKSPHSQSWAIIPTTITRIYNA